MIVLGIDPGLTRQNPTGLAILDDRLFLVDCHSISPKGDGWQQVVGMIAVNIARFLGSWVKDDPLIACNILISYELPHVATNPQATIKLAHICGIIVANAMQYGFPVIGIQPSEAKKALTGKGNASKDEMIAAAQQQFGLSLPKDIADACGIALAGLAKYRKG